MTKDIGKLAKIGEEFIITQLKNDLMIQEKILEKEIEKDYINFELVTSSYNEMKKIATDAGLNISNYEERFLINVKKYKQLTGEDISKFTLKKYQDKIRKKWKI